ncbi:MAG: YncE family protein, partial [Thermoplasmata archaeon]
GPFGQAYDPATGIDYVSHSDQAYLAAIDLLKPSRTLPVIDLGGSPSAGAYDAASGTVYVPESYWNSDPVDRGSLPDAVVALQPSGASSARSIPVAPFGESLRSYPTGFAPVAIADVPSDHKLFVANYGIGNATILNASTGTISGYSKLTLAPTFALADPTQGLVLFADPLALDAVSTTNDTVVRSFTNPTPCPFFPQGPIENLAVDPVHGLVFYLPGADGCSPNTGLFVWNPLNGSAVRVNTATAPYWDAVAFDPADGDLYIADATHYLVDIVNATNLSTVAQVPVGSAPSFVAFDPVGSQILVADRGSNNLTILNGTSPAASRGPHGSVSAGNGPSAITVASALDEIFVSDAAGGSVVEIATRPVIAHFAA